MNPKVPSNPLLSIRLMTYNHANFIEDALRGIDMQQTNFPFEVVIGDDFSTDNNLEKIRNYRFTNPNLTVHILERKEGDAYHTRRLKNGRFENFVDIFRHCKGQYFATIDGDDYWTHPQKLQKQVDFLEKNERAIGCFHNSKSVDGENKVIHEEYFNNNKGTIWFTQEDALKKLKSSYSTSSLVFRGKVILDQLDEFLKIGSDFVLDLFITRDGDLYYMDESMSAYRIHDGGIWQGSPRIQNLKTILIRYLYLYNSKEYRSKYKDYLWDMVMQSYKEVIYYSETSEEKKKYTKEQLQFLNYFEWKSQKFLFDKMKSSIRYKFKLLKGKGK